MLNIKLAGSVLILAISFGVPFAVASAQSDSHDLRLCPGGLRALRRVDVHAGWKQD